MVCQILNALEMNTGNKKKVLVGMSGGVDSTVTACLLQEQGYEVIGVHLRFWTDPTIFSDEEQEKFPQNKCCTLEGLTKTRKIAAKLGIPFYVLNFEDIFKEQVVDFFIDGYGEGITPNPCVECNRSVKFGLFLDKMKEMGADYVATGHYARKVEVIENGEITYKVLTAKDKSKDQSYFLYTLTQEKLRHILFPIGEFTKPEVRELAKKFGIDEVNNQKESQNLCFFPERDHSAFLQRYLEKQNFVPGPIITTTGQKIGTHQGLPLYTIGQRKGLGIGGIKGVKTEGEPWYVVKIDKEKNALVVGKHQDLYTQGFIADQLSFISGKIPPDGTEFITKIRHRFLPQPAKVKSENKKITVEFLSPQRAVTPGQSVVFYQNEELIGGGIISKEEV